MTDYMFYLKPCPFCGGKAGIYGGSILINLHAMCEKCGACSKELDYDDLNKELPDDRTDEQWEAARKTLAIEVRKLWNKRKQ
jgi:hypothetical protein